MSGSTSASADPRCLGGVFNAIADAYDRHRPVYPDKLVDRACARAGLAPGAQVLEIGCGTGQLTGSLLARGLHVTAVEPGEQLIARARERLAGAGEVRFVHARLEDAELPPAQFQAAFSASAIHWVDPDLGWQRIADALAPQGTLALLSYFGVDDEYSREDQRSLTDALARVAPEVARDWPTYHDADAIETEVARRSDNISSAWAWLSGYDVARPYASKLFDHVALSTLPVRVERTADELAALLGTMSFWSRLTPAQREALLAEHRALEARLGQPIRSSTVACAMTARRLPRH